MTDSTLAASTCAVCGLVAVPPEPIGCERCGAAAATMEHTFVPAAGSVTACAVVHHHVAPEPPTPFVVVEIALDAGPVVRSLLRGASPDTVVIGGRVTGAVDDAGRFAFVAVG
ncbi:MAG: hypothetical protein IT196_07455 [Acidimicrobiales bacterium]|nr:hypothetical protein [Acidimicrobiales bacterium]